LDKVDLIELMEGEAAKLSPEGREMWEEWEFMEHTAPDLETRMAREYEITERIFELPVPQQIAIARLVEMLKGLCSADKAEDAGEDGEKHLIQAVINAAILKDREEGRMVDPYMTIDQAITRLEESG
jgi:hypothetical protein